MSREKYIKALVSLGLTLPQAKIYFGLLELGTAAIKQLSEASNVDRPDAYRAAVELLRFGLIEKVISSPVKYRPLPFIDAAHILMQKKAKEETELFSNIEMVIRSFRERPKIDFADNEQFVLIPGGQAAESQIKRLFQNLQKELLVILPRRRLYGWGLSNPDLVLGAANRNLTIKIITDGTKADEPRALNKVFPDWFAEVRSIDKSPTVSFRIYDFKEILLNTGSNFEKEESSWVWSNNLCMLELATNYFYTVWKTAKEYRISR